MENVRLMKGTSVAPASDAWQERRVFVTGANGFIGSHLSRRLVHLGAAVSLFLRPGSRHLRIDDIMRRVQVIEGDLLDASSVRRAVSSARADVVYHLAAVGVAPGYKGEEALMTNVLGTFYLLDACVLNKVQRFVYTGSCFEYGPGSGMSESHPLAPTSIYAASKSAGQSLTQAFGRSRGLSCVSIRPFTAYGPWERTGRLVPQTIMSVLKGEDILLSGGKQERDFVYVDDLVGGFLLAGQHPGASGWTFNLCSGQAVQIKEVVEMVLAITGSHSRARFGALPYRPDEMFQQSGDNALAWSILGWAPQVSLQDGLKRTIRWYRANLHLVGQLMGEAA